MNQLFKKLEADAPEADDLDAGRYWRNVCQRLLVHGRPKPTDNQAKALEFINAYLKEHDQSPSYREIGDHMGIAAGGVGYLITGLKERGYIHNLLNRNRSITIIDFPEQNNIDI